ncbi:MAG: hypothetical protein ABI035_10310 [Gemmatimonadaceae bacterium]
MPWRAVFILPTALFTLAGHSRRAEAQAADSLPTALAQNAPRRVSTAADDSVPYVPLSLSQKADLYVHRTYSVRAILGASYAAGLAQLRHTPQEWGSGISGYARRDAAAYGGGLVRRTAEFGFVALLREDPRLERSTRSGFFPRTEDVLRNTVTVRTDANGRRLAWSRAAAALVTGFAVNSWEPPRMHSTHHALMLSLAGFLSYGSATFTQEFTPDVKRYIYRGLHIHNEQGNDTSR